MSRQLRRVPRWMMAAGVAGALAFGAQAAAARPHPPADRNPACRDAECFKYCRSIGAQGGRCVDNNTCQCIYTL